MARGRPVSGALEPVTTRGLPRVKSGRQTNSTPLRRNYAALEDEPSYLICSWSPNSPAGRTANPVSW
jgi:hypothetical protein